MVKSMDKVWDDVKAKSPDDAARLEAKEFKDKRMDMRQQAPGGRVVNSLDEAFDAAQRVRGGFGKLLEYVACSCGAELKHAPTKKRDRAEEKVKDAYEGQVKAGKKLPPACAWIPDLERASFYADDATSLFKCIDLLEKLLMAL